MSKHDETTGLEVAVSAEVLAGLEAARDSGAYNMFDADRVADWCYMHGHPATSAWMRLHKGDYVSGIFNGFAATPQPEAPEDEITEEPDDTESDDDFLNSIDDWLRDSNPVTLLEGMVEWLLGQDLMVDGGISAHTTMVQYLRDCNPDRKRKRSYGV